MATYIYGFLDRIVESKDSNGFLVRLRLYLAMIWKKSKRGWNRFRLRYEIWFSFRLRQKHYLESGREAG
jgi:hypothetical protein